MIDNRANTNKMWISPPTLYAKTPIAQPIKRITAITYSKLVVINCFLMFYLFGALSI